MTANTQTNEIFVEFKVNSKAIAQADKVRLNLLLPDEYRRATAKSAAAGLVGGAALAAATASVPRIEDKLLVRPGRWHLQVSGDGLAFANDHATVLVQWSDIAVWGLSKSYLMLSTTSNGRVVVPIADMAESAVAVIRQALIATKAPKRRIGAGGNVAKFSEAGRVERVVQIVLVGLLGFVLLAAISVFALFGL